MSMVVAYEAAVVVEDVFTFVAAQLYIASETSVWSLKLMLFPSPKLLSWQLQLQLFKR